MNTHRISRAAALLAAGLLAGAASAQQVVKAYGENVSTAGDHMGSAVSILGDVDGDGIQDWIVGSPNDGVGGVDSGTAYVLTGGYYSNVLYEIHGFAGDNLGTRVCSAGDWDKDGRADFIVSAPGYDTLIPFSQDKGIVRVYSGKTGAVLASFLGPQTGCRLGEAVAGGGDVNGDGWPDIIVGAPSWDVDYATSHTTNEGFAAVYNGKTGALVAAYTGSGAGQLLGGAVSFADELNLDHDWEYAIGSPGYSYIFSNPFPIIVPQAGRVDVYSGATNTVLFFKVGGANDHLGTSIAMAGDTNKNFVRELLVGAPGDNTNGSVYLYEGATGTLLHTFSAMGYGPPEGFGTSVGPVGDVNKDGYDDVAIGAPMDVLSVYGGYVNIYSGKDDSIYLQTFNGPYAGILAGLAVSPVAGDISGDGWPDALTSWPYSDYDGTDSGMAVAFGFLHFQPDLGFKGPAGPTLSMYGTELFAGGQADMKLAGATASSPAWLMASASQAFLPFKGGILVPNAAASLLVSFPTDPQGQVLVKGIPGGGGYVIVYCQFLVKNAAYAQGWGISNALAVEILP